MPSPPTRADRGAPPAGAPGGAPGTGAPAALPDVLDGEVAAVVFANPDNGWAVVELGSGDRATGPLAPLVPGQPVRLLGRWTRSDRYGPTFEAVAYELTAPRSEEGLEQFLASDRFPGVGRTLASRLVEAFGLGLGEVATTEPERLATVRGVSPALARSIGEAWREAGALGALVADLAAAGIPQATAHAVFRAFGDDAARVARQRPYALLRVRGVRWAHAEALARAAGIDRLDPARLAAGAATAHRQRCAGEGHLFLPTDELVSEASRLLRVDPIEARRALDVAAERRALVADDEPLPAAPPERWYAPEDLAAERGLADEVDRLLGSRSRVARATADVAPDPDLTDEQAAAVRAALTRPVSVLTGGPGTGKTRTVLALVRACAAAGLELALCAPTGRAAKRLEEVTGHTATTVHRLLEARPVGSPSLPDDDEQDAAPRDRAGGFEFGYGSSRRLPFDVVVADEWSMADVHLAWSLARSVEEGAHLVLVGDADQLPSVGPGAVLRDLLEARRADGEPVVAATRLTVVHRQAAASRIVTLAHEINAGTVAEPRGRQADVFAVPEHPALVADRVAEIVAVRAPAFFGCPPSEVQVLAPMYRGPAGVDRLNERLKERLNPPGERPCVAGLHEGDRVVQTRNDAELDVANGDIGEVIAVDARDRTVQVAFAHGTATYKGDRAGDLAPAWCLTVHKSQGGEWPVVVLVLDPGHRAMLWRELVYTAVTRASQGLLLVGDPALVVAAARRTGSGLRSRRTLLAQRLAAAGTSALAHEADPGAATTAHAGAHGGGDGHE